MKEEAAKNPFKKRYISLLIIAGFIILISSQNTQMVTLHFLFWSASLSLVLLIYITFILGIAAGLIFKSLNNAWSRQMEKKQSSGLEKIQKKEKKNLFQTIKKKKKE